jgi:hypothetical protein
MNRTPLSCSGVAVIETASILAVMSSSPIRTVGRRPKRSATGASTNEPRPTPSTPTLKMVRPIAPEATPPSDMMLVEVNAAACRS